MALFSFSPMASVFPIPVHVPSARIQLAFVNMNTDAIHPARGASVEDIQNQLRKRTASYTPASTPHSTFYNELTTLSSTFVESLWDASSNEDLVSQFLNNSFCTTCARSSDQDCLPLYQRYSVQDYFYLEDYVKYKAHRLLTLPVGNLPALQDEAASILSDAEYAISAGQSYVTDLHGSAADLAEGNRNIAGLAYGNVLQNAASQEDWFNLHVLIIPCIYGWTLLAEKLLNDPLTRNDTIFYKTWIQPNTDPSYANNLTTFLDANDAVWENGIDTGGGGIVGEWNTLFRTALKLEIALFASAFDT
ncbi:hypothetical protein MMC28_000507, partial [Mycoblastus sanguinarius]|nr:hypothetical protein [Mycoblastus sanguinarius]